MLLHHISIFLAYHWKSALNRGSPPTRSDNSPSATGIDSPPTFGWKYPWLTSVSSLLKPSLKFPLPRQKEYATPSRPGVKNRDQPTTCKPTMLYKRHILSFVDKSVKEPRLLSQLLDIKTTWRKKITSTLPTSKPSLMNVASWLHGNPTAGDTLYWRHHCTFFVATYRKFHKHETLLRAV